MKKSWSFILRIFSLAVVLLLYSSALVSQSDSDRKHIKAVITDSYNNPLPYANFIVYSVKDTVLVGGTASNERGLVDFDVIRGRYLIKVGFLAYKDKWLGPIDIANKSLDMGTISLQADMEQLKEVEITAERSQMELMIDKRVINVQQDASNRGKNAADILDNVPSVSVSVEGDVSLRGNENVRILINGKPSGLTGISGNAALRQLQGDMIDRIEVITNPSAKYEAQGEVGIINIILKKDQRSGLNGSVDLTAGIPSLIGASGNLNWRKKDWNIFTSIGYRMQENPGFGNIDQRFSTADTSYTFKNSRDHIRGGSSVNARLGADWSPSEQWTFTISGLLSAAEGKNDLDIRYLDFDEFGNNTRSSLRSENEREDSEDYEFDFNMIKSFSQKDRKWTFDIKSSSRTDLENANISQDFGDGGLTLIQQRTGNTENENNLIFQTDYVHPLKEKEKLEFGLRSELRSIVNDFSVEQFEQEWVSLPAFTNDLRYNEHISAAYGTYSSETKKWGYQIGLRSEYSDIQTELLLTQEKNPRSYLNLFPSAFLSYKTDKASSYQLNYSRRINRPRFRFLLPFYGYGDSRNFFAGNPDLNPEFSHNIELNRLSRFEKGSVVMGLYSRFEQGSIQRITLTTDTSTYTFPVNLGSGYSLGTEFSGNLEIMKYWSMSGNLNFYFNDQQGVYEGKDYGYSTWAWNGRLSQKFTWIKVMEFQTVLMYRSGQDNVQGRTLSMTSLNIAASRDVFKGKGTLTLNISDVFNSRLRRSIIDEPGYYSENEFQWRARLISLNLNYRINQKKSKEGRRGEFPEGEEMGG